MLKTLLVAVAISHAVANHPAPNLTKNPINDVKIQLSQRGLTQFEINSFFSDPRLKIYPSQTIATKKVNWKQYQSKILQVSSVSEGRQFIVDHQSAFENAEVQYGVPKEVIAAVIRIETDFGSYTGTYSVPNVFYSFLRHNVKTNWAAANLVDLLVYAKDQKIDPFTINGSYAGAIGYPQFLPSSIVTYAVDGNADGKINLLNPDDAIPSLANFLAKHNFSRDQKIALTGYYGSSIGYPDAALKYAAALKNKK